MRTFNVVALLVVWFATCAYSYEVIDPTRVVGRWTIEKAGRTCEVVFTFRLDRSNLGRLIDDPHSCSRSVLGSKATMWTADLEGIGVSTERMDLFSSIRFDERARVDGRGFDPKTGVSLYRPRDMRGSARSIDYSIRYMVEALRSHPERPVTPGLWILRRNGVECPIELTTRPYQERITFAAFDRGDCTTRLMGGRVFMWSIEGKDYEDTEIVFDRSAPEHDAVVRVMAAEAQAAKRSGRPYQRAVLHRKGSDRMVPFRFASDFESYEAMGRYVQEHMPKDTSRWRRIKRSVSDWWRNAW